MGERIYTIRSNGDGSFSVLVTHGEGDRGTSVHGFKSDFAAETWAQNHKHDHDRIAWAQPEGASDRD